MLDCKEVLNDDLEFLYDSDDNDLLKELLLSDFKDDLQTLLSDTSNRFILDDYDFESNDQIYNQTEESIQCPIKKSSTDTIIKKRIYKKKRPRHNLQKLSAPKILKNDIRRTYANIFSKLFNSHDHTAMCDFVMEAMRPDFKLVHSCHAPEYAQIPLNHNCFFAVKGAENVGAFWYLKTLSTPDIILTISDPKIISRSDGTSKLVANYMMCGTEVCIVPYAEIGICDSYVTLNGIKQKKSAAMISNKSFENMKLNDEHQSNYESDASVAASISTDESSDNKEESWTNQSLDLSKLTTPPLIPFKEFFNQNCKPLSPLIIHDTPTSFQHSGTISFDIDESKRITTVSFEGLLSLEGVKI